MNKKLNIGDYVRTEDGIEKVLKYTYDEKIENGHCVWFENKDYGLCFTDEEFNKMKPSPNIIDLIEIGDYVNGGKVYEKEEEYIVINADFGRIFEFMNIYEKDIKSIVTKEQFSQMEYKIGDKK